MPVFSKLYHALQEQTGFCGLDEETVFDIKCGYCFRKERVLRFEDIRRADHICMSGQHLVINIGDQQVAAYTHHAIVKSVEVVSQSSAMVRMIHFYTTPYSLSIQIQDTTELLDLHYSDIYIIRYRHKSHSPDTIIARAEGLIKQNKQAKYSVMSCNCEHFCNWCCVGIEESYQVDSLTDALIAISACEVSIYGHFLKFISKMCLFSSDDLFRVAAGPLSSLPWITFAVSAVFCLIATLYSHIKLEKYLREGSICSACCLRKKQEIWIQFVAYCGLQAGGLALLSFIISAGAGGGIVAGAIAACSILTIVCMSAVPRVRKKFFSPFQGRLLRVTSLDNILVGDVISFDHWKISHDGIVSAVKIYHDTADTGNKRGEVRVIHYSLPSVFGRRTIVEETIEVDLRKRPVLCHDYTGYTVHEPEIAVERARQRVGETKFGVMTNRSCHFCHWAKVNEDLEDEAEMEPCSDPVLRFLKEVDPKDTISNLPSQSIHVNHKRGRQQASMSIEKRWARIRDDIKPGHIIEYKNRGCWHKAVSTEVRFDDVTPSQVYVTIVHYGKRGKVCEETFRFNLNREDVWIYKFHPLYRYKKDDVIRRARARIGKENYYLVYQRSSHLAREIVVKQMTSAVTEMDELKRGDVVTFYYWSIEHDAIVTNVIRDDSKTNTTGKLCIVHYALDHLFAVRTVKEEIMPINLKKELLYLKRYDGYVTYPVENVVKRARSRVGEQRFSIRGNTSSDLAHWAKVVQHPVVIAKSHDEGTQSPTDTVDRYLLVPEAGKKVDDFQRFRVNAWSDLYPGVIVEYRYYLIWHQCILSYMDERSSIIKVIHYGTDHLFATRTIIEDTIKLNLRYNNIWIYRGHPKKCYKAGVVLENARKRLGEQRWCRRNRSWDFCKDCVLRKMSKEV